LHAVVQAWQPMQRVWSMTLAHFTARFCGSSSMKAPGSGIGESELYHAKKERKHAHLQGNGLAALTNAQAHKKLALVDLLFVCDRRS
jgi:hypothetical protein